MVTPSQPTPTPSIAEVLRNQIMGFRLTQALCVAARLGLADHLADGAQSAAELARRVGAHPEALYRLLRALASVGVFAETADRTFELTPAARLLQRDAPGSLHGLALVYGDEWLWRAYGRTLHSVLTGRPAFDEVHGETFYEYLATHEAAAATFHGAMSSYSGQEVAALLAAYDFGGRTRVIDVGGGHGRLLGALVQQYPAMSGVLYDLPEVIAQARPVLAGDLVGRVEFVAGDFFSGVPAGGDLYVLKSVLHNWDDERCVTILRHCRRAMTAAGRVLVVERVVPPGNAPAEAKLFDLNMLVVVGGQERTAVEFDALLRAAGLRLTRVLPTGSPVSLLEAVPEETD